MRSTQSKLPSGVWGQIRTLLFQPEVFFKGLATSGGAWLLIALVLMGLTGLSEVRRQEQLNNGGGQTSEMPGLEMPPMDMGGGPVPMDPMGGGVPLPPTDIGGGEGSAAPATPINEQLEQILGATGTILAMWGLLTPLLALVTLFNGHAPRWKRAVQVAVWATVPLGLLALLQLAYYGAGGKAGEPGMLGIVDELPFYAGLTATQQSLTLSAASRITLFHLWTLALVWIGARHTLRGKKAVVLLVVAAWAALIVVVPVVTGAYHVEPVLPAVESLPDGGSEPADGCDLSLEALGEDNNPNILSDEVIPFDNMPVGTSEAEVDDCGSAPGTTEGDLVTDDDETVRAELPPTPNLDEQSQHSGGKPGRQ